jgi:hypothetical protein
MQQVSWSITYARTDVEGVLHHACDSSRRNLNLVTPHPWGFSSPRRL